MSAMIVLPHNAEVLAPAQKITLPPVRRIRPGLAVTTDGVWSIERDYDEGSWFRWMLRLSPRGWDAPWGVVVACGPTLRGLQEQIALGGHLVVPDAEAPWWHAADSTCWAVRWLGGKVQRAEGTDLAEIEAWAAESGWAA